jgi:hypothetical protein
MSFFSFIPFDLIWRRAATQPTASDVLDNTAFRWWTGTPAATSLSVVQEGAATASGSIAQEFLQRPRTRSVAMVVKTGVAVLQCTK